jgi:hypothetical protein
MSFDQVEKYLDSIHATQVEWEAYVSSAGSEYGSVHSLYDQAAEKHASQSLEMLREMVAKKSPNNLAKVTSAFLEKLAHYEKSEYDWVMQQALKYHAQTPSDDMLIPLIEKSQSKFQSICKSSTDRKPLCMFGFTGTRNNCLRFLHHSVKPSPGVVKYDFSSWDSRICN